MTKDSLLPKDREIKFPEFILLRASAGTGKTHALTLRFTQFLLSEKIKANQPAQILAITFTRNAAKEMKSRILSWLKDCYFGRKENLSQILSLITIPEDQLQSRAEKVLENILGHYSDFQVMTIDSFMAEVFKASAIDLGLSPDFDLTLDSTPIISYAFSRFLRRARPESAAGQLLLEISRSLQSLRDSQARFFWDPTEEIRAKFLEFYNQLEAANRRPLIKDLSKVAQELVWAEKPCLKSIERLKVLIKSSGLELNRSSAYYRRRHSRRISDWLDCSFKTFPVQKPRKPEDRPIYDQIGEEWLKLETNLKIYKAIYARNYFQPFLQVYQDLLALVEISKKEQSLVLLEDIHRKLAGYLDQDLVPDIYFCLGTAIYHYLIDEFQDTSPLQWQNLQPLIENALSQGGSLFIVGDTKQAIYGFREADYRIMVDFISGQRSFASAPTKIKDLTINRRSQKEILDFVSKIFP
ncbi:MAG: UvrD-helicase domain-containing protein [Candidatus Saccharicenans sp.]